MSAPSLTHPHKASRRVRKKFPLMNVNTLRILALRRLAAAALIAVVALCPVRAQESNGTFAVLNLPTSSHVAALGGHNITTVEDTPWAGTSNPALYASVADRSLGLNFMNYAASTRWLGAGYVMAFGERHSVAITGQYLDYGSMNETDESGTTIGRFSANNLVLGGAYSYVLSDYWAGGAALRFSTAKLADYSSTALSVDVGINYYDELTDLSFSAVLRNIGAQLSRFDDRTENLPFTAQLGVTKGLENLPVRIHVTLTDLTRWKSSDYYRANTDEKLSFSRLALNHVIVGLDLLPTDYLYLSAGYNFRRAYELKAAGSSHGAGLTFGAGLNLSRLKLGLSYAKYHLASSSFMVNAGFGF